MHLTESEIAIIRESYERMRPEVERVAGEFYADLFRRDPRIRALFRENLEEQGMRFMGAIRLIVDNLDNPEEMDAQIRLLAEGHAAMQIRPEMYHTMQEALLDTFRYALGAKFTDPVHLAWRSAFSQICDEMQAKRAS